jgi:hypothetical protein
MHRSYSKLSSETGNVSRMENTCFMITQALPGTQAARKIHKYSETPPLIRRTISTELLKILETKE